MKIAKTVILGATFWEFKSFIKQKKLRRLDLQNFVDVNDNLILHLCGIGTLAAEKATQHLISQGGQTILLCGFAGSLVSDLKAGDFVLDAEHSDPDLAQKAQTIFSMRSGNFFCAKTVLSSIDQKIKAAKQYNAIAVEMESEGAFKVCRQHDCKFLSLRTISDEYNQSLPPLALNVDAFGRLSAGWILKLLSSPWQWVSFYKLAKNSKKAQISLTQFLMQWTFL